MTPAALAADAFSVLFGDARGRPDTQDAPAPLRDTTGLRYDTLEDFYTADDRRRNSPEVDFGVNWHGPDGSDWPRYRVSYAGLTGEVFACAQGGRTVVVLGVIPADFDPLQRRDDNLTYYATVDRVLGSGDDRDGWTAHMNDKYGLTWVKQRIAAHRAPQANDA